MNSDLQGGRCRHGWRPALHELPDLIPNSSVRNAIDCALWDLECKRNGRTVWELAGIARQDSLEVDITLGINLIGKMCADARKAVASGYRLLKIKADSDQVIDKVGGLTPALELARAAKARGMGLMMGCGGPTSLGIAPAYVVGTLADYCDLDGPALLHEDRVNGMSYRDGRLECFSPKLWG